MLGSRTHTEVLDWFKKSDLFVLGCQIAKSGDRDGIPNVLVESLAMGVPAVSTTVSALPEILIDGETGITVAPGDSTGLAEAILQLLNDATLRKKVSSRGKAHVKDNFDNRRLITELASIFKATHPALLQRADETRN